MIHVRMPVDVVVLTPGDLEARPGIACSVQGGERRRAAKLVAYERPHLAGEGAFGLRYEGGKGISSRPARHA